MFHPTERDWALAASWTSCDKKTSSFCRIFKELFVTKNLGEEWTYTTNYVFDFEWAVSKTSVDNKANAHLGGVLITREKEHSGH